MNLSKEKRKTKWHANREAEREICILFTMEREEKRQKQETDYNKILVGARTRDRIQTNEEEEEIRDLTARIEFFFCFSHLISK